MRIHDSSHLMMWGVHYACTYRQRNNVCIKLFLKKLQPKINFTYGAPKPRAMPRWSLIYLFVFLALRLPTGAIQLPLFSKTDLIALHRKIVDKASGRSEKLSFALEWTKVYDHGLELYQSKISNKTLSLFPVTLGASIMLLGPKLRNKEDAQFILPLLIKVYEDGTWGAIQVWNKITRLDLYRALPEAVAYFEIIAERSPFNFEARGQLGKLYTSSRHVIAAQRIYRSLYKESISLLHTGPGKHGPRFLSNLYLVLGTSLMYMEPYSISQLSKSVSYLKNALELEKYKSLRPGCPYHRALEIREMIKTRKFLLSWKAAKLDVFHRWQQLIPFTVSGEVAQIYWKNLTYEMFLNDYVLKRKPLIIKGLVEVVANGKTWGLEYFKSRCGDMKVFPKHRVSGQQHVWAGMINEFRGTSLRDFINSMEKKGQSPEATSLPYVFDESLPVGCKKVTNQLTIPKYFVQNLGLMASKPGPYRGKQPSIFVGPKGSTSGLHIDSLSSHFWQALFVGTKKWTFYPFERDYHADLLLYRSHQSFLVDPHNPDFEKYPLFEYVHTHRRLEAVVSGGDVVYVPPDLTHAVENMEDTVAISQNYIDFTNLLRHWKNFDRQGKPTEKPWFFPLFSRKQRVQTYRAIQKRWRKYPRDIPFRDLLGVGVPQFLGYASAETDWWSKKEQDGGRFLNVSFLPSSFPSISDLYYPVTGHGSFSGKLVKMEVENRQCEYLEETKECAQ